MRTTLNIDDEVFGQVKDYANARSITASKATSLLLQRALRETIPIRRDGEFFAFSPGPDAPVVTLEHALRIEDESE
jgi:hypothetical protein